MTRFARRRDLAVLACLSLAATGFARAAGQAGPLTLNDLLWKAAGYLTEYEAKFAAVVSEEEYIQRVRRPTRNAPGLSYMVPPEPRVTRGDVLLVNISGAMWVGFRDIFEVNGAPVRDREGRLQNLFLERPGELMLRATEITNESARYNLGSIRRNINLPTMALDYLRGSNQVRCTYRRRSDERVGQTMAAVLEFRETAKPTIIHTTSGDEPATGRFWIDPDTGRVLRTELFVAGRLLRATIDVVYGYNAKVDMWVPVRMREDYDSGRGELITALAIYSNFRKFSVNTSAIIK